MTICEWQAGATERTAAMLANWVRTTDPAKLDWCPKTDDSSNCRSVLDQVGECVRVNRMFVNILQGKQPEQSEYSPKTSEEAQSSLLSSAKALADVLRGLDDSVLANKYQLPFGEVDGATTISIPAMNMFYHGGQVCYIQRLYGDTDFHFPDM